MGRPDVRRIVFYRLQRRPGTCDGQHRRAGGRQPDLLYFTPATIREREEVTTLFVGGEKHGEKTEFSIDLPEDGHLYRIFLAPQSFRGDGPKQGMELYLGPGERIAVRATYDPKSRVIEYTLAGSEAQQRWRDDEQKLEPLRLQLEMLGRTARMISPYRRNDSDTVMREMQRLSDSIQRHKEAYIAAHPADPASAYHLISLPNAERFDSLYRTLDPAVQQGVLREWMDLQLEFLAKQSATEQAREAVVEGARHRISRCRIGRVGTLPCRRSMARGNISSWTFGGRGAAGA